MRSWITLPAACFAAALVAACATQPPATLDPRADPRLALLSACDAWTATLTGLARLRAAGQLTAAQVATVDQLIPSVRAVCDTPPPADAAAVAATLVETAIREATR